MQAKAGLAARLLQRESAAGVGEGAEDGAGVVVDDLAKVHGDGEEQDEEEQVDAQERVEQVAERLGH